MFVTSSMPVTVTKIDVDLGLRSKLLFCNIFPFLAQCSLRSSIIAYRSVTLDWPPVS